MRKHRKRRLTPLPDDGLPYDAGGWLPVGATAGGVDLVIPEVADGAVIRSGLGDTGIDITADGVTLATIGGDGLVHLDRISRFLAPDLTADTVQSYMELVDRQVRAHLGLPPPSAGRCPVHGPMVRDEARFQYGCPQPGCGYRLTDEARRRDDREDGRHLVAEWSADYAARPSSGWEIDPGGDLDAAEFLSEMTGLPVRQPVAECPCEAGTCTHPPGDCCLHGRGFTCPRCGMTSLNLADLAAGYCGHCHMVTVGPVAASAARPALPPRCPEHGTEMAHSPRARWFACRERIHGHLCRWVLADADRDRHGDGARFTVRSSFPCCEARAVDEFTGAMTEAEHRAIRQQLGLDETLTEETLADEGHGPDLLHPEPPDLSRGHWQNELHP